MTERRPAGPLPVLLIGLTVVSGLVDAFSFLVLGRVFVANMTGNVLFLGFAVAGVGEAAIRTNLLALVCFVVGARVGGRWAAGRPPHRGRVIAVASLVQAGLVAVSAVTAEVAGSSDPVIHSALVSVLAAAMGGQNAVVRRMGVTDLPTTVVTRTLTSLVVDTTLRSVPTRRLWTVVALFSGAAVGAALLRWVFPAAPLWLAVIVLAGGAGVAWRAVARPRSDLWR